MIPQNVPQYLNVGVGADLRPIAVRHRQGRAPGLLWLGGFKSDMQGIKAQALDRWAAEQGRACTRFDYSGHGESGGDFVAGTIGRWLTESTAVFTTFCRGPQVVVGSSMGGWLALLMLRELRAFSRMTESAPLAENAAEPSESAGQDARAASISGLVLIAPAVDFTEELMWRRFPAAVKQEIERNGVWARPSPYSDEPHLITKGLIEEARSHLLLGGLIETGCPVRILQGVQDKDVPWQHAVELVSRIGRDDVVLTLVKGGDHRLSRPEDIERLIAAVAEFKE
ncbi:MAG: alpha/beta hydrolase [Xanthobacteraceae bacterium]